MNDGENVAIHEAGHAVVGVELGLDVAWVDVDLCRTDITPPRIAQDEGPVDDTMRAEAMNHIVALMAGQISEELHCGGCIPEGDAGDVRIALEYGVRMAESDADRQVLLEEGRQRARDILTRPWAAQAVSAVAKALYGEGGFAGETVEVLVGEAKRTVSGIRSVAGASVPLTLSMSPESWHPGPEESPAALARLRALLRFVPPGDISDRDPLRYTIAAMLANGWQALDGYTRGGMADFKLRVHKEYPQGLEGPVTHTTRVEHLRWRPPILSFSIVRHRAYDSPAISCVQRWNVNLTRKTVRRGRVAREGSR